MGVADSNTSLYFGITKGGVDMPRGYEKLRDAFKKEGMGDKAAKGKAARIWNAKHKSNPVTRKKGK